MSENIRRILNTSRPHKISDWMLKADKVGMRAGYYSMSQYSPEFDDTKCGFRAGIGKVNNFVHQEALGIEGVYEKDEFFLWLVAMDMTGYIKVGEEIIPLTTCRGQTPVEEKIQETVSLLVSSQDSDGKAKIYYQHSTGYGLRQRNNPELTKLGAKVVGGMLILSPGLIEKMGTAELWDKFRALSKRKEIERPLINADATAGLDLTMVGKYVRKLGDPQIGVEWKSEGGKVLSANGNRLDRGFTQAMTTLLRGAPMSTMDYLANLTVI